MNPVAGYRLLIVEDEEDIREGLHKGVDWAGLGFTVDGIFSDGRKALEHMERSGADAVITDIVMPHCTGLELAQWVHANRPGMKVVILSGFDNFHYAQEAIRCGVKNYLLKPTNLDELYALFRQLRTELDEENSSRSRDVDDRKRRGRIFLLSQQIAFSTLLVEGHVDGRILGPLFQSAGLPADTASTGCWECVCGSRTPSPACGDAWETVFRLLNDDGGAFVAACVPLDDARIVAMLWPRQGTACQERTADAEAAVRALLLKEPAAERIPLLSFRFFPSLSALTREGGWHQAIPHDTLNIAKIKEYIREHVCEDISVTQIARSVSLNPAYVSRLFKAKAGVGITHYIQREKMSRARELLRDPRYRVYQVGERIGYRDTRHFYKVFKQVCGMTPQAFRNTQCDTDASTAR